MSPFEVADDDPQEMPLAEYQLRDRISRCMYAGLKAHARRGCPVCNPEEWRPTNQTGDKA